MANKLREGAGSLALAVAQNARHRDFEIIVQNRQRHAAEKGKCRDVPIKKSFRRLRRIGLPRATLCVPGGRQLTKELLLTASKITSKRSKPAMKSLPL